MFRTIGRWLATECAAFGFGVLMGAGPMLFVWLFALPTAWFAWDFLSGSRKRRSIVLHPFRPFGKKLEESTHFLGVMAASAVIAVTLAVDDSVARKLHDRYLGTFQTRTCAELSRLLREADKSLQVLAHPASDESSWQRSESAWGKWTREVRTALAQHDAGMSQLFIELGTALFEERMSRDGDITKESFAEFASMQRAALLVIGEQDVGCYL